MASQDYQAGLEDKMNFIGGMPTLNSGSVDKINPMKIMYMIEEGIRMGLPKDTLYAYGALYMSLFEGYNDLPESTRALAGQLKDYYLSQSGYFQHNGNSNDYDRQNRQQA